MPFSAELIDASAPVTVASTAAAANRKLFMIGTSSRPKAARGSPELMGDSTFKFRPLGRAARWGTALADNVRVAHEDDLIPRFKQFVAQLGHAHSETARTGSALRECQRLITRRHEEVRVIDTLDERDPALPGRSRVHTRHGRR